MSFALITGASKGIGKAIAEELAKHNYSVLLVARSESLLRQLAQDISTSYGVTADYLALNLSDHDAAQQVKNWCDQKGYTVTVLVNNAGYGLSGEFDANSLDANNDMMRLNMLTLANLCQVFLPMLKQQPKAYILNIASSTAYQALPLMSVYAATKVFVLNFSRALRYELRKSSVSVTVVSPGATATDFNDRANIGQKARKAAEKVSMTPQSVAKIAVEALFAGQTEVVPGLVNKVGKFFAWLLPASLVEGVASGIYEDK
ncbi:MAG: SDR family oxidoreductase [Spirosomataceae bacterium]